MIDWIKIKSEYINTNISQRKLADKYNVSFYTLKDRANKEKWKSSKDSQQNRIATKTLQKTAEKIAVTEADRIAKVMNLADTTVEIIEQALSEICDEDGKVETYKLRQVVQSIKDIKEIVMVDKHEITVNTNPLNDLTVDDLKKLIDDD